MLSSVQITGLYAGILALMFIFLSVNVIRNRFKHKVGLGSGESKELEAAIRIHGNFSEYIPLGIILMAIYELNGGDSTTLHVIGSAIVIGRIGHFIGLSKSRGTSLPRVIGTLTVFISFLVLAVLNIWSFLG